MSWVKIALQIVYKIVESLSLLKDPTAEKNNINERVTTQIITYSRQILIIHKFITIKSIRKSTPDDFSL